LNTAPEDETRRAWVEVDLGALRRNFATLAERAGGASRLLVMLKADGYGLGAVAVARALGEAPPWAYGVATLEEGAELRRVGVEGRVIVFSPCPPLDAGALAASSLEPAVSSLDALRRFGSAAREGGPLSVHLEIDTGMGRLGLLAEDADRWTGELAEALRTYPLRLASTFTHFHSADSDPDATREQERRFRSALDALRAAGVDPGLTHAANSAALFSQGTSDHDLARPGIYLYGGGPGDPEPVASVRARVLDVRTLPAGHAVSYGATWRAEGPARLATLGIGSGDGLRTRLSNRGFVLLGGRKAPIRGAVCMDVTVVQVAPDSSVAPGDRATLLGTDGEERITLAELADAYDAIDYEVLTGLGGRLSRIYLDRQP
jgi:alanine racemase